MIPTPGEPPRWVVMWTTAAILFALLKLLAWSLRSARPAPIWRHVAFLWGWPGMDADTFLHSSRSAVPAVKVREWLFAAFKTAFGIALLSIASRWPRQEPSLVAGWLAMTGIVFFLHFGLFHVLSCLWRTAGCDARPIMHWPIFAKSVSDFWGRRWNLAFRDVTHRAIFVPASRALSPATALLLVFFGSGLIHDLAISVPAGGGYGGPTLYFLLQGAAVLGERSNLCQRLHLRTPAAARMLAGIVVLAPLPLAFHSPFVSRVVAPFVVDLMEFLS